MTEPSTPQDPSPESTSATAPQSQAVADATTQALVENTENYIEAYHAVAEWIRFADAKAGAVLTLAGVLAGILVPTARHFVEQSTTEHLFPYWRPITASLFVLFLVLLTGSAASSLYCITPARRKGKHPALGHCDHFHPAAIAARYSIDQVDTFIHESDRIGVEGFRREVLASLLLDSHISNFKYSQVVRSIRLFSAAGLFALLYLLALNL